MAYEIAGISTCMLCGAKFTGPTQAGLVIRPGQPNNRVIQYYQTLVGHLMEKHRDHANAILLHGEEFKGMLYLMNFQSTDQAMQDQRNFFRWKIHQRTLNAHVTDQNIEKMVSDLAVSIVTEVLALVPVNLTVSESYALSILKPRITEVIGKKLKPAFTAVRDELEEPGKFAESPGLAPAKSENGAS